MALAICFDQLINDGGVAEEFVGLTLLLSSLGKSIGICELLITHLCTSDAQGRLTTGMGLCRRNLTLLTQLFGVRDP